MGDRDFLESLCPYLCLPHKSVSPIPGRMSVRPVTDPESQRAAVFDVAPGLLGHSLSSPSDLLLKDRKHQWARKGFPTFPPPSPSMWGSDFKHASVPFAWQG